MLKKIRFLITLSLVFAIILLLPIMISAHASSQAPYLAQNYFSRDNTYFIGGEHIGWGIDEELHTNGTYIAYSFETTDTYLTTSLKSTVASGASLWSGTVTISLNPTESLGEVSTFYNANTSSAGDTLLSSGENGHLSYWDRLIKIPSLAKLALLLLK